ncbi:MAG: restriction endonuclease subunit S [Deltaproteobacteria bacterium]|nr:restriction endonuclease subunit S [Deltaproteobacteria bacterium]
MRSATTSWPERLLGELMDIARQTVMPGAFPNEQFLHFSIPAWDERRAPALEVGASIGSAKISVTQPTLLVSKLNPRIPRVVHVKNPVGLRHCASTEFIPYVAKDDSVSLEFFRWFLQSSLFQRKLERIATGSTNSHTRARPGETLRWSVPCPTLEDQQRIAAVLDTVDEMIAKTESVIAKLKQVRAGLLRDLLTRGLDEHGQLRDPSAYPEQFHDSPLGRIPRVWILEPLGVRLQRNTGTIQTGPFGSQLHAHEYTTDGVPVIMPQDILEGGFDDTHIARIPTARAHELERHRVRSGDLIFARRGDLSRCAAVIEREVGWLCGTGCLLMRFEQASLSPSWLSLAYRHDFGQRQIAARAVGTTMVNLNTTLLAYLQFAFPRKEEQEEVVRRVAKADALIENESANLAKLGLLKSGLMTDLLTGHVRVPERVTVAS